MNKPIIEIKNVGKRYAIAHQKGGYITLRDVISTIARRPFSFLKTKAKQAVGIATKEEFWALRNINVSVSKGEIVGIIGPNGAGKSTLLKILSRITPPTEGEAILRGRVVSLLEVGTGFHPELTGRENIFLNSAILGMSRSETARKFDEIVAFAGVEKFLDTPVKYYSSGMTVRLGFSIAAHLEPDILIVDEVLAVGDAEFQKKCLGKIEEVRQKEGRTVLFVSHNMAAVRNICGRSILIEGGRIVADSDTETVIDRYLAAAKDKQHASYEFSEQATPASISSVSIIDNAKVMQSAVPVSETFSINIVLHCKEVVRDATLALLFYTPDGDLFLYSTDADEDGKLKEYPAGKHEVAVTIPPFLFNVGSYTFDIMLCTPNVGVFGEQKGLGFEITDSGNPRSGIFWGRHPGRTAFHLKYHHLKK